ncbi:xylulokinase [Kocuria sp. LUK]|uniref:Xylulose kinase n=1 Tax=Kocuria flava TaxID=446860 RepID=A0A2N4T098_9MICC|nr:MULTISPECIES: xylulokinase [Kocuria]MCD1144205.1 xylulokinase [Kocuria sp. LUK]PLC11661.1 xylulose kinase [Kocuria flava]
MIPDAVLGIDSSTQSCKAVLVAAATGKVLATGRAPHPEGTEVDPAEWTAALHRAAGDLLPRAGAVAVAGQQHGLVALDARREPVRHALLWNDTRSAAAAGDLVSELGGPAACAERTGSVTVASFTASKLRWLRDHEPDSARRTREVLLPHDWLTWQLTGRGEPTTDHGDASGTGYWSPRERAFDPELATQALGREAGLPRILDPAERAGTTAGGAVVAAGTGDNMGAALGLHLRPGDVCVSVGTSGVASMVVPHSVHDASGLVAGFADATGRCLPLACTLNGARVLELGRRMLGVEAEEFDRLALAGTPGAHGLVLLPYLGGERTPDRPGARGTLHGFTTATTREDIARAVVEGLLCSLDDAVQALVRATGTAPRRIVLIGGGARSAAVRALAPSVLGHEVEVPAPGEYVALGAARQAAWALAGGAEPPAWPAASETRTLPVTDDGLRDRLVEQYGRLRDATEGWG